ncbi:amidase [Leucobacter sp. cx-328]|uniref:amidase n=1 Tax=unclassified Leucobacter TaxID=2621730 RepID=UPI00165D907C|nr:MULTISPECIES: amidase [unclassified Leucobacter]MBC9943517.1 amidase [Leucobacter sp. cx-328]
MSALPDSASELTAALRAGEITARETTEHYLAQIETHADLGAFVSVSAEQAIDAAGEADIRRAALTREGRTALPILHGVPVAHKDLTAVTGSPTTRGSATSVPLSPSRIDSPGVATLRAAGTISLGKTQVPEYGLTAYSENRIAPPARNPLDPTRTPGGSSGGSAAAVAARLLPFAPGSDGGGSIRIPALACGLIGLKPGLGTIPTDLANGPRDEFGAPQLTVSGPLAHTPTDAALLGDAMRGVSRATAPGAWSLAVRRASDLTGARIGVSTTSPFADTYNIALSDDASQALDIAVRKLGNLGHHLEETAFSYGDYAETFGKVWTAGLALLEFTPEEESLLMPLTRVFRERALQRGEAINRAAAAHLHSHAQHMRAQWGLTDFVLTPGLAMTAPAIDAFTRLSPDADYELQCQWAPYTSMVNVAGLPAIAVPMLRNADGMSMGVQLIGRAGSEAALLQLAEQLLNT